MIEVGTKCSYVGCSDLASFVCEKRMLCRTHYEIYQRDRAIWRANCSRDNALVDTRNDLVEAACAWATGGDDEALLAAIEKFQAAKTAMLEAKKKRKK